MGTNLLPRNEAITWGGFSSGAELLGVQPLFWGWLPKSLGLFGAVVTLACEDAPQPCLQHRVSSPCFL